MMNFINKTFVITGASSGIGRGLAIALASKGAALVLGARNQTNLAATADACINAGGKAVAVPTDVTNPEACQNLIEQGANSFGAIDALVNNAGIRMHGRFEEIKDLSVFERIMQVNYLGAVYCTYYALSYLKASQGLLVGISSLTGKTGVPTRTGYASSKHAMQGFFDSLRIELRGTGVDVLVVSPGFVATDIRNVLGPDDTPISAEKPNERRDSMSVDVCVSQILPAIAQGRRELVMTPKGRLGLWLKLLAPGIVDRMAARAVRFPGNMGDRP